MTAKAVALRHARSGVSEVVAIILLVAITVVLTGILYIMVTDLGKPPEVPPRILLTATSQAGGIWTFQVSADTDHPFSEFSLRLWINDTNDVGSMMNPLVSGTRGNLTYEDTDSGRTVSSGDMIAVQTTPGHKYEVFLLWKGQNVLPPGNAVWDS